MFRFNSNHYYSPIDLNIAKKLGLKVDLIVDGNSVRHIAQMTATWQMQVEKYFSLLHSVTGEPITESYDEIAEEFPEVIIREIVAKIDEAIRPNYKETKKN